MYASRRPQIWDRLVHRQQRLCANLTARCLPRQRRSGAVIAELAILLPLLLMLSLVSIGIFSMLIVNQSLRVAAYAKGREKMIISYGEAYMPDFHQRLETDFG
jgi:hypothetical protein